MSTMIERIAQAILDAPHTSEADTDAEHMRYARMQAKAALEAMREPTEAMTLAPEHLTTEFDAYAAWIAMIDEALRD